MPFIKAYSISWDAEFQMEVSSLTADHAKLHGVEVSDTPFPGVQFWKPDGSLKSTGSLETDLRGHPGHAMAPCDPTAPLDNPALFVAQFCGIS